MCALKFGSETGTIVICLRNSYEENITLIIVKIISVKFLATREQIWYFKQNL